MARWPSLASAFLRCALSAAAFVPLLSAGFVYWDDRALLTQNPRVQQFQIGSMFTDLSVGGYYPLTQLSLALDYLFFGLNPLPLHLENWLWHMLNAALVYLLCRRVFAMGRVGANAVALLFALHPANVEAVAWISGGRKDLLCSAFYLGCVLMYARALSRPRTSAGIVAFALGLAALLSKAMAVTLPFALLALWWRQRGSRAQLIAPLSLLPVAAAIGTLEFMAQKSPAHLAAAPLIQGIPNAVRALGCAFARILAPHDLAVFYDPTVFGFGALDVGAWLIEAGVVFWLFRSGQRRLGVLLVGFVALLVPVLKLIPFGQDSVFQDRYLYLPGILFLIFAVRAGGYFFTFWAARREAWIAELLPAAIFGAMVFAQTQVWASQETLWLNVLAKYPGTAKAYPNLALYFIETDRLDQALPWAQAAVRATPTDVEALSNLGVLYTRREQLDLAERTYVSALALAPDAPVLWTNLGYVYLAQKQKVRAVSHFERALALAPGFANAVAGLRAAEAL